MAFLPIFRIVVLCKEHHPQSPRLLTDISFSGISVVFAIIALGLSAHLTSLVEAFVGETVTFAVLALATACLTILTLPIMWGCTTYPIDKSAHCCATPSGSLSIWFVKGHSPRWCWLSLSGSVCFYYAVKHSNSILIVFIFVIGILWIMWLATAADAVVSARRVFPDGCIAFVFGQYPFTVQQ